MLLITHAGSARYISFFCNHPSTTVIYTLSLHDALPIFGSIRDSLSACEGSGARFESAQGSHIQHRCVRSLSTLKSRDRKSTRLNSSHTVISYAVFCLKKKT